MIASRTVIGICKTRRHPSSRRGMSTALSLAFAVVIFGLMALVIDFSMVTLTQLQMEAVSESAALAGASELFDRELLCPELLNLDLPASTIGPGDPPEIYMSLAARARARDYAGQNQVSGVAYTLPDNPTNDENGDIVLGVISDPTDFDATFYQWVGSGPFNSVLVKAPRTLARGNPITMWISRSFGLASIDITSSAKAAFDQRVYGFQPGGHVPVPVLPMIAAANSWPNLSMGACVTVTPANDRFAVQPITGVVTSGQDGIPEFELRMNQSATAGMLHLLPVAGPVTDLGDFKAIAEIQTSNGMFYGDLEMLGGMLRLGPSDAPVDLAASPDLDAMCLAEVGTWLNSIIGKERIWPLGTIVAGSPNISRLENFAAGRVVSQSIDDSGTPTQNDDSLVVVVQPCLLSTSTALVREGTPRNPWLGKIYLVR